jgi:hypothetical protein
MCFGGKASAAWADHLALHIRVSRLLKQDVQVHHRIGHRGSPDQG